LAVRTKSSFELAKSLELSDDEKASVADEFGHVDGLLNQE
jgi:hypothetical protein